MAEPVDPLALKGKAEVGRRVPAPRGQGGVAGHDRRLDSPMVGRERPLRMLLDAFESAAADRACHLFTVLGPAGIGKSRLVREFVSHGSARDARVLTGPVPVLRRGHHVLADHRDGDPGGGDRRGRPAGARARTRSARRSADAPDADASPRTSRDSSGSGGRGPVEAPWAVRRFFETLARERPLVAVFDDIHWAEPTCST